MPRIELELTLWRRDREGEPIEADRVRSERSILAFLEAMVCHNVGLFESDGPRIPDLYASGVRYQREDGDLDGEPWPWPGLRRPERWRDVLHVLEYGNGDCEDLACYRASELRARSRIDARAVIRGRWSPVERRWVYHVVVAFPDGSIEDPSARLGMLEAA